MRVRDIWELFNPKLNIPDGHKILMWSRDGDFIKSYKNATEAALDNGLTPSQVSMNLNGSVRYCKKKTIYFTKSD